MINAYDFDGTIYDGDSSLDFYLCCLKKNKKILLQLPIQIWGIILYLLGIIDKTAFKEKVFSFLKRIDNVDTYIKEFWQKNDKKIKAWYLEQKKESDIIISASPEFLLKHLEKKLNFKVIASRVNKETGKFEGKNCHDYEKIKRYKEIYKNRKIKKFYSDSIKADRAMLEFANEAYLVKGDNVSKIDIENYVESHTAKITKLFLSIFSITFFIILFGTIFDNKVVLEVATNKNNIIAFILSIILLIAFFKICKNKQEDKVWIFCLIGGILIFTMQILVLVFAKNSPGWDWKIVYQSALDYVNGKLDGSSIWYFNTFPNNKYLFAIQIILFKILKIIGLLKYSLTATHIINIICVDISILLTLLTVKKMYGKKSVLYAITLIILSSAFYIYLPIFYSDTAAMPIPIALIYIFISMDRDKENIIINKKNILLSIVFSIIALLGIKIKVTTIIVFIAIIICSIINKQVKKQAKIITLIALLLIFELLSLNYIERKTNFFNSEENNSLPYTHWVMMGLYEFPSNVKGKNYIGVYNAELYSYSFKLGYRDKIISGNKKKIAEKLTQYGPIGYLKFLYRKSLFAWGDGTFHGSRMISENKLVKNNFIQELIYCSGKYFVYYYILNTAILFAMYILFIIGSIKNIKENEKNTTIVYMAIYGLLFFLLIWEASARYLIHYVPLMIVGSISGMLVLEKKTCKGFIKKYEEEK